jgi:hypothetical protein
MTKIIWVVAWADNGEIATLCEDEQEARQLAKLWNDGAKWECYIAASLEIPAFVPTK